MDNSGTSTPLSRDGQNAANFNLVSRALHEDALRSLLRTRFGFDSFRPYQEEVCVNVLEGRDVLLVMPTGAGKSLCYQLPGLARQGTTIVISPLLALIEDQVEKLKRIGLRAERIHSGRTREESRAVCYNYLSGNLDYLFIAPERLSVPGFIEMLKKRLPSLITIDEAHCISQWGHDFRPDYRLLGERLKELRPAPVIALTATAIPMVQDDIAQQLGLKDELRSIQGFRRNNIAIQVVELDPSSRSHAIHTLLKEEGRLPAIVYASTRKAADQLHQDLREHFKVGVYHAGMNSAERDQNQNRFLDGKLDVIVATVAFGMGIDKANIRTVIHAALPASVEGYYQEIGRAGRDGLPSRAVLLQSYADHRTHNYFFDRDYPDVPILRKIYKKLSDEKINVQVLRDRLDDIEADVFEKALGKLAIHRGAIVDFEEGVLKGTASWENTYPLQRDHKQKQTGLMNEFTKKSGCRMVALVKHFGDEKDSGILCGICDFCNPASVRGIQQERPLTVSEQKIVAQIMATLEAYPNRAAGRIFTEIQESSKALNRGDFERLLKVLALAAWIEIIDETFQVDGRTIVYRKVSATPHGRKAKAKELAELKFYEAENAGLKKKRVRTPAKTAKPKTKGAKFYRRKRTSPR
jgi:DNA topoisomerase-3